MFELALFLIVVLFICWVFGIYLLNEYEKKIKSILGKRYKYYFNRKIMKEFHLCGFEASEAANEMVAYGRCKQKLAN